MTHMEIQSPIRSAPNGYKVDVSRGQNIGRVSSEWFNRPPDERYLSLTDLHNSVKRRSERSKTRIIESEAIRVEASRDNPERLTLMLPEAHAPVTPTHWSFGQLASLVGAPATYLRQLPAALAGINLQHAQAELPHAVRGCAARFRRPYCATAPYKGLADGDRKCRDVAARNRACRISRISCWRKPPAWRAVRLAAGRVDRK